MSFPITSQSIIPEKIQKEWDKKHIGHSRVPIDAKYGYIENVNDDNNYKNIDYRDTIAPLWNTLYNELDNLVSANKNIDEKNDEDEFVRKTYEIMLSNINSHHQAQVNVALCASIIQLGNYVKFINKQKYKNNYTIDEINCALSLLSLKK